MKTALAMSLLSAMVLMALFAATASAAAAACPNETFRVGPGAKLPDCRAYEQVTPVDKNGGTSKANRIVQMSTNGTRIAF